jgi:phage replication-related protein YjqB (UPF0714/DUF867 family)
MSTTGANNPVVGGSKVGNTVEQEKRKWKAFHQYVKGWQQGGQQGGTGKKKVESIPSECTVAGVNTELTSARKSELRPKEARADGVTSE